MTATVCRKSHFNAAHRLYNPSWDNGRNAEVFGVCSNPNYHGHNYDLVVKLTGEIDPVTGYVFDMKVLKDIVEEHVIRRYDHKNLNLDVEEFRTLNPTAENIPASIWKILRSQVDPAFRLQVVLYETERNYVEYSGDEVA